MNQNVITKHSQCLFNISCHFTYGCKKELVSRNSRKNNMSDFKKYI